MKKRLYYEDLKDRGSDEALEYERECRVTLLERLGL